MEGQKICQCIDILETFVLKSHMPVIALTLPNLQTGTQQCYFAIEIVRGVVGTTICMHVCVESAFVHCTLALLPVNISTVNAPISKILIVR